MPLFYFAGAFSPDRFLTKFPSQNVQKITLITIFLHEPHPTALITQKIVFPFWIWNLRPANAMAATADPVIFYSKNKRRGCASCTRLENVNIQVVWARIEIESGVKGTLYQKAASTEARSNNWRRNVDTYEEEFRPLFLCVKKIALCHSR